MGAAEIGDALQAALKARRRDEFVECLGDLAAIEFATIFDRDHTKLPIELRDVRHDEMIWQGFARRE